LTLINDVLEISKIEAGQLTLNVQSFNLHDLLNDVAEMLRIRADRKGLSLILEHAPDVPKYISSDENKLRQVLINILNNAVKFTQTGGVTMLVRSNRFSDLPTPDPYGFLIKNLDISQVSSFGYRCSLFSSTLLDSAYVPVQNS
jgi:light-regulated signal transduction histidine kinase (bacteriophytochrome)